MYLAFALLRYIYIHNIYVIDVIPLWHTQILKFKKYSLVYSNLFLIVVFNSMFCFLLMLIQSWDCQTVGTYH